MIEEAGKADGYRDTSNPSPPCCLHPATFFTRSSLGGLLGGFLDRSHDDLDDMRRLQFDADAGPHWRIGPVPPLVPGAVHFVLQSHAVDIDDSRQNLAFVGSTEREAFINSRQRFHTLLIHRWRDRIGRDRYGKYKVVVDDRAAPGGREAWKTIDHGELPSRHRMNLLCKGARRRLMQRKGVDLVAGARIELCDQRIMARNDPVGMAGQAFDGFPALTHVADIVDDRKRAAAMEIAVEMRRIRCQHDRG